MDAAAFQALYSVEKPKLEDENLIFFCQMGKRGLQATQLAQGLGYRGYGAGGCWLGAGWGLTPSSPCCPHPAVSPQGSQLPGGLQRMAPERKLGRRRLTSGKGEESAHLLGWARSYAVHTNASNKEHLIYPGWCGSAGCAPPQFRHTSGLLGVLSPVEGV